MCAVNETAISKQLLKSIALSLMLLSFNALSAPITLSINYIKLLQKEAPALSNYFNTPEDLGYKGAQLAINDSNTTGKFLQQSFTLNYFSTMENAQAINVFS